MRLSRKRTSIKASFSKAAPPPLEMKSIEREGDIFLRLARYLLNHLHSVEKESAANADTAEEDESSSADRASAQLSKLVVMAQKQEERIAHMLQKNQPMPKLPTLNEPGV